MNLFKRFEVWLLLILAIAATAYVFWQDQAADRQKELVTDVQPARPDTKPSVLACRLERDFGNARLDVDLRMTNRQAKKLVLIAPDVRLLNATGKEVPAFVLPVEPPAQLPANSEGTAKLRFWLEKTDLSGKLTLDIQGERVELKTGKPFDLEKLQNAKPRSFTPGGDWSL